MTELDERIRTEVGHVVAEAPPAPTIDDVLAARVRPVPAGHGSRRLALAGAAVVLVAAAVAGVLVARQDDPEVQVGTTAPPATSATTPAPPSGAGSIPRLVIGQPGWTVEASDQPGGQLDHQNDDRRVVYLAEDGWSPAFSVLTTTGDFGLGDEVVDVNGRQARLIAFSDHSFLLGWRDGPATVGIVTTGVTHDELVAFAQTLAPDDTGAWVAPSPPEGFREAFRTTEPPQTYAASTELQLSHGDQTVEATVYGGGPDVFWGYVEDRLADYPDVSTVEVRGVPGLLAGGGDDYRLLWQERDGEFTVELSGTRAQLEAVAPHVTEVDEATWQQLTAG